MAKAPLNTDRKKVRRSFIGQRICYICPKCGWIIHHRKKMHFNLCMRCGQYLDWSESCNMNAMWILAKNAEDAGYWADQYEKCNGTAYEIDIQKWTAERKPYPLLLYFPFPNGKGYGRFARMAAKEAKVVNDICKSASE